MIYNNIETYFNILVQWSKDTQWHDIQCLNMLVQSISYYIIYAFKALNYDNIAFLLKKYSIWTFCPFRLMKIIKNNNDHNMNKKNWTHKNKIIR